MIKNKLISNLTLIAALISPLAFADTTKLELKDSEGSFHCKVDTLYPLATVNIDSNRIKVNGFCGGQNYVTSPGHIEGMPVYMLVGNFFQYTEDGSDRSVTITSSVDKGVTCYVGQGDRTKPYGDGKYC